MLEFTKNAMPTLYVENVPDGLYASLRARARSNRRSISAETLSLLEQSLPTADELRRRAAFYRRVQRLRRVRKGSSSGPSTEILLREDRAR
jgi:plasmid stability protein